MSKLRLFSFIVMVALLATACAPVATPTPAQVEVTKMVTQQVVVTALATQKVEVTKVVTQQVVVTPTAQALPTATPQPTPVAQIPPDKLVQKGHLAICSDIPYPPQEFFDDQGNVQGVDIDLGNEIANRLGLKAVWVNSVFDTIIASLTGGKCDIIMSAMNITDTRKKQVNMIPYFQAGQGLVVLKGNPSNINAALDLCGQPVAVESGTTNADWLQSTGDYAGKGGMKLECEKAGKKAPVVTVTQKDSDAFQQLLSNKVVAYATDSPVAGYYTSQHADQFQVAGQVIEPIPEGIVAACGEKDCTNAPLTEIGTAVQAALKSMIADGTYLKILTKWGLANSAVK